MSLSISGSQITFPDGSVQGTAPNGFKNRIINGAMVIDQRNAGASGTGTNNFPVDRWRFEGSQSGKLTWGQNLNSITPPAGFAKYTGFSSSSAYSITSTDYNLFYQPIEGLNTADLGWGTANAQTVTLSFWVRSSLTGTFGGAVINSAQNRSYPFAYTINAANTWEQKTITIAGDTSGTWLTTNGSGIDIRFSLGTGSTYSSTANTWAAGQYWNSTGSTSLVGTSGATWYITGVQLEKGSAATSFDYRPYGTELQLCQRYYCSSFSPSESVGDAKSPGYKGAFTAYSGATGWIPFIAFPVQMRANPTMTAYRADTGSTAGRWGYYNGGWNTCNSTVLNGALTQMGFYGDNGGSFTANNSYLTTGNWTASAEL
jgi:hypothetical protein